MAALRTISSALSARERGATLAVDQISQLTK